jgi:hypothetical protein
LQHNVVVVGDRYTKRRNVMGAGRSHDAGTREHPVVLVEEHHADRFRRDQRAHVREHRPHDLLDIVRGQDLAIDLGQRVQRLELPPDSERHRVECGSEFAELVGPVDLHARLEVVDCNAACRLSKLFQRRQCPANHPKAEPYHR